MPLYDYKALSLEGKKVAGTLEALSDSEAKEKLRSLGLMLVSLHLKNTLKSGAVLQGDHLVSFTGLLAQLIGAGMPLYEGLIAVEEQYRGEKGHQVIVSLCEKIKGGASLSDAMRQHPRSFDKLYCAMLAAGEASGALDTVLKRLSDYLEKQQKVKRQITTALIYPAVLSAFALLVIISLLTFVVPSMEALFEGREMNALTAFVISSSYVVTTFWWLYIPLILGLIAYLVIFLKSQKGQHSLQRLSLKLPLVKTSTVQAALSRFSRTMATLQEGGVTVIESLRIARDVMHNIVLEDEILRAEQGIVEGSSLSSELHRAPSIPHMVPRMLAISEETGSSALMFHKIADIYEAELEKNLDRVMALAQPVILIVMGGIIGVVLAAVLLPLSDMSNLATN